MDNLFGLVCLTISILICSGILIYLFILLLDIKYQLDCVENKIDKLNTFNTSNLIYE